MLLVAVLHHWLHTSKLSSQQRFTARLDFLITKYLTFRYCNRKICRIKSGTHKQSRCCLLKNYSAYIYEEALRKVDFPNYQNFENINNAYFFQKVMGVIDLVAPIKTRRIKQNLQKWFHGEVAEKSVPVKSYLRNFTLTK